MPVRHWLMKTEPTTYSIEDLEAWVQRGAVTSTSDPRGGRVLPAKRHVLTATPPAGRAFR